MVTPSTRPAVLGEDPHHALGVVQHLGPVRVGEPGARTPARRPRPAASGRTRRPAPSAAASAISATVPAPSAQVSTVATPSGCRAVLGQPRRPARPCRAPCRPARRRRPAAGRLGLLGARVDGEQPLAQATGCGSPGCPGSPRRPCGRTGRAPGRRRPSAARRPATISVSRRLSLTASRWSRRFCPALPLTSSARSTSSANEPNWLIHFAAVFSPTPGMPGRLSDGSPRSAAKSGYCCGREPVLLDDLLRGEPGQLGDALRRVQHRGVLARPAGRSPGRR